MIRSTLLLIRTSLLSVLFLFAAIMTLASVLSDEINESDLVRAGSIPSLAPLARTHAPSGTAAAALQSALFDPGRRPETVSGPIDDLRVKTAGDAGPSPVAIAGVLIEGTTRKAMLAAQGRASAWSAVGAEVGGWRVASIDAEGAMLERDGQSLSLKIAERYKLRGKAQADAAPAQTASDPDPYAPQNPPPGGAPADNPQPPDRVDPSRP